MSLDKMEAVPVDTHVWQLAVREYHLTGLSHNKSLTDAVYKQIGMSHWLFSFAKLSLFMCTFAIDCCCH